MEKLYLDIDGVLITAKNSIAPVGIDAFIQFITSNYDCYWLTTHCKGDSEPCIQYLAKYLSKESLSALTDVHPTNWNTLKTEAINLNEPFFWLDDYVMLAERKILEIAGHLDSLIIVDLNRDKELNRVINILNK